jgi:hypothetical protein
MFATELKKLFLFSCVEKKSCFRLLLYALQYANEEFFKVLIFTLFKSGFLFGFQNYFSVAITDSA